MGNLRVTPDSSSQRPQISPPAGDGSGGRSSSGSGTDANGSSSSRTEQQRPSESPPPPPRLVSELAAASELSPSPGASFSVTTAAAAAAAVEVDDDALVTGASIRGSVRAGGRGWQEDAGAHATPSRMIKFQRLLESDPVDVDSLRKLSWSGVPVQFRAAAWQTLLGYLPSTRERQATSVSKKKAEYQQTVSLYFGRRAGGGMGKSDSEQSLLRQVLVDVPRTNPEIPLFHVEFVQRSLERVLYVWAMRHPASGYVQGINDLATPFYAVFLSPWADIDCKDLSHVNAERLAEAESGASVDVLAGWLAGRLQQ